MQGSRKTRVARGAIAALAVLGVVAGTASAATFNVTKPSDTDDGVCDADCSLREAVDAAEAAAGPDTVKLPPGTFTLSLDFLLVGTEVTIEGAGAGVSIIDGSDSVPIVACWDFGVLRIEGVTIRNGRSTTGFAGFPLGGGVSVTRCDVDIVDSVISGNDSYQRGGGLLVGALADVTLTNVLVTGNAAAEEGGGISLGAPASVLGAELRVESSLIQGNTAVNGAGLSVRDGSATVLDSTIGGNIASGKGAGIWVAGDEPLAELVVQRSLIDDNTATGEGGGLLVENLGNPSSSILVEDTTIRDNDGSSGGGASLGAALSVSEPAVLVPPVVFDRVTFDNNGSTLAGGAITQLEGSLVLRNSTLSGNGTIGDGGGLRIAGGTTTLSSVTIDSNTAGGSGSALSADGGQLRPANSILGGSCDLGGGAVVVSSGGNLESPGATCFLGGTGDQFSVPTPGLAGLADNGGFTETRALQIGSAALGAGLAANCLAEDQRGFARTTPCDVGAYEDGGGEPIFGDGFDDGSLDAWDGVVPRARVR